MIVTTKQLFEIAYGKFAVGAYNINNMEQTLGLFRGNLRSQAPFIIQISKGARSYADKRMLEAMITSRRRDLPRGHLRRAPGPRRPRNCSRLHRERLLLLGDDRRFAASRSKRTSASPGRWWRPHTPRASPWRPNWASWAGWRSTCRWMKRTPTSPTPAEAEIFVKESGCDSLAVAIGTSHGAYKFCRQPGPAS